jgi:glycosyltransferase involved in cell wall biosynthesis
MRFSVVIPTVNRLSLLKQTLESVWRQTFLPYEVIVVDDGSTDGTAEHLKTTEQRARVFAQPNRGPGAARNLGANHARGDYLAFLDSDDLWFPWSLEVYAQAIKRTEQAAFLAGKPWRFSTTEELNSATGSSVELQSFADYLSSGDEWRWWGVSSFVVRRDAFVSAGGFANEWINGEDADLALRLGVSRGFAQVTSPCTFAYREHMGGATKNINRTVAGIRHKLRSEMAGQYPGGAGRARERLTILTRHIRPVSLECLRQDLRREAWEFYRATFGWHVQLRRWKYLVGFPLKALFR